MPYSKGPHAGGCGELESKKRAKSSAPLRQGIAWLLALLCLTLTPLAMARTLLVVGDSISAGYGLAEGQGWVRLLERRLQEQQLDYQVVNASISGDTTAGGLARLPRLLADHRPDVVAIELGGNDGLRGQPLAQFERNLTALVEQAGLYAPGWHPPPGQRPAAPAGQRLAPVAAAAARLNAGLFPDGAFR